MTESNGPTSPRIAALSLDLAAGNSAALTHFWREVVETGTPLIEKIDGVEDERIVTFLWQSTGSLANVAVITRWLSQNILAEPMSHLPGSDVWFRSFRARSDLRGSYHLSPNDPLLRWDQITDEGLEEVARNWQPDPLNARTLDLAFSEEEPWPGKMVTSVFELPDAPPQPWSDPRPNTSRGRVEEHQFHSVSLDNDRSLWVYTPPGYDAEAGPYPLLVVFDGAAYIQTIQVPVMLDNLRADGCIPPTVAVMVGNVTKRSRRDELPCNAQFADALAHEMLPWVRERYRVTDDPGRTVVAGSSFGGLASAFVAFQHPEVFGLVLSQSGSYWWPGEAAEWEWLPRQFAASPLLPVRFYLNIGLLETDVRPRAGHPSMLVVNRHMRTVLKAKGYPVGYAEFMGGHDYACWRATLADGLIHLLGREIGRMSE